MMSSLASKTIAQLDDEGAFDDIVVADVLGYYKHTDGTYYTTPTFEEGTEVTGVMSSLAGKTIAQLDDEGAFDDIVVADVLGYYKHTNGKYYTTSTFEEGTEVAGIMSHLADSTISSLSGRIKELSLGKILGVEKGASGNSSIIEALYDSTIETLNADIKTLSLGKILGVEKGASGNSSIIEALYNSTIETLNADIKTLSLGKILGVEKGASDNSSIIEALYNSTIETLNADIKELSLGEILGVEKGASDNSTIINALYDSTIETLNADLKTLSLGKMLGVEKGATGNSAVIDALYDSTITTLNQDINNLTLGSALGVQLSSATGVIKVLYDTKITELNTAMGNLKVYQAIGYYYNEADQKYYNTFDGTEYKNEVQLTGIMKAIAQSEVDQLSTTIENLKAKDVFDRSTTPILNLFVTKNGDGTENTTELDSLTVMSMPNAVVNKINASTTTVGVLIDAGVITTSTTIDEDDPVRNLTISELIDIALQFS